MRRFLAWLAWRSPVARLNAHGGRFMADLGRGLRSGLGSRAPMSPRAYEAAREIVRRSYPFDNVAMWQQPPNCSHDELVEFRDMRDVVIAVHCSGCGERTDAYDE